MNFTYAKRLTGLIAVLLLAMVPFPNNTPVLIIHGGQTVVVENGDSLDLTGRELLVENGGRLVLEDGGSLFLNDVELSLRGDVEIRQGGFASLQDSRLRIDSGGRWHSTAATTLVLSGGSSVQISAGGELRLGERSRLCLADRIRINDSAGGMVFEDEVSLIIEDYSLLNWHGNVPAARPVNRMRWHLGRGSQLQLANRLVFDRLQGELQEDARVIVRGYLAISGESRLLCGPQSAIQVFGALRLQGEASANLRLQSTLPRPVAEQRWQGILLEPSADTSHISYSRIFNAQRGFYSNRHQLELRHSVIGYCGTGLLAYGGKGRLEDNIFEVNDTGLRLIESSPLISGNSISEGSGDGIWMWRSSPVLLDNEICDNGGPGVALHAESAPFLGDAGQPGNNTICDNAIGLDVRQYSRPFLRYNRIFGNSGPAVRAGDHSMVTAPNNWWGGYPVPEGSFVADSTSAIDYYPVLDAGLAKRGELHINFLHVSYCLKLQLN